MNLGQQMDFMAQDGLAGVIGGVRGAKREFLSAQQGLGISNAAANFASSGTLEFSQNAQTSARLTVIWVGDPADQDVEPEINTTGLGGADLMADGDTGFIADVLSIDRPIAVRVEVYTDDTHGSYWETVAEAGSAGPQYIPFAAFVPMVGMDAADFSNVGAIMLMADGKDYPDTDLSVGQIATGVPEPSTVVLLVMGLAGLGLLDVRRRRA